MIFETLSSENFPESYHSLVTKLETESIFFSRLWFDNFLQTVVSVNDTIMWIGCKTKTGEPLFLWPLWKHRARFFQPTRITGLANYYTTLYQPLHTITDDGLLKKVITATVQKICQQSWDYIDLYPLNLKSPAYPLIIEAFQQQYKHTQPYYMHGNWFLLTNDQTYKEYYAMRPSRLKNTIKRRLTKLKKQNVIEFRICTNSEESEFALQHFQAIYAQSWKNAEPYPNFIPGIVKAAAEEGWLRLGLLLINHEVAAAQIWFSLHHTAYIYKLCHHPKFAHHSPGTLLTAYLMEKAFINDQVLKVDFLTGDDLYKQDWMNQREERWGIQITNPKTVYGLLLTGKNKFSSYLKQLCLQLKVFTEKLK